MAAGEKIFIADKATLDKVYNLLAVEPVWGFIEHNAILSPTGGRIEYTGLNKNYKPLSLDKSTGAMSLNDWADHPIILGNKPYMVKSDGTPDYRLNENDYTKKEDGTASDVANTSYDGGAFAWLPKIYKQEYMVGYDRHVNFSMTARDGYEPVGFIDPDNNELEGVWLPMFYGSILNASTTPKMASLSGLQPCYNNATAAEKTAISNFSARAAFLGGPIVNTIIDLLILFAGTTNLQEAYGYGNRSGYDASLEPTYGVKQNAVVGGGQFYGTSDGKSLNKVFHSLVLITQNQYMRDPYTLCVNGRIKVSRNYTYDLTGATYLDTGIDVEAPEENSWCYPHIYRTIPGFGHFPVPPYNGSTSLGGCDGLYRSASQATFTAVALRFGNCDAGSIGGPRAVILYNSATNANWDIGAAILLLPPVGVAA